MSSDNEINYFGKVDDGKLTIVHRNRFISDLKLFEGKEVEINVRRKRKRRSNAQNAYYWSVLIPHIMAGLKDMGMRVKLTDHDQWMLEILQSMDSKTTHEFLKKRFIESIKVDTDTGEIIKNEQSTKKMTVSEFMDYMAPIFDWARDFLGIKIPLPGENFEIE